jgi:hypothetical protein
LRKTFASTFVSLVVALGLAGAAMAAPASRTTAMRDISITNFKVNKGAGTVTVFVRIHDWKMYPKLVGRKTLKADGGHWHIFVNGKYNTYSASATKGVTLKLKKGDYKITVALANNDHSPVKGTHPSKAISVMID